MSSPVKYATGVLFLAVCLTQANCDDHGLSLGFDAGTIGPTGATPTDDGKGGASATKPAGPVATSGSISAPAAGTGGVTLSSGTGGAAGTGSRAPTGGATVVGGSMPSTGGVAGRDGVAATGGVSIYPLAGGATATGGAATSGDGSGVAQPRVEDSGFVTVVTGSVKLTGYVSSSTAGSGSSIALTYGPTEFCATGTVAPNSTYKSWATAGFNVNQDDSGASGSTASLPLLGNTVSVRYVNKSGSSLEFQLYDGSQYWCYLLPPAVSSTTTTFPLSSLNTQCWDGKGAAFKSGTAIRSVSLVVPGTNATKTAFDFCFQGMAVN